MDREDARIILTKELKCNSLDECNLKCDECGMLTDPKDLMDAYKIAIRDIEAMHDIKKAMSMMLGDEFIAYVCHKILTIEEED